MKKSEKSTVECSACHHIFDILMEKEVAMGAVRCPHCRTILDQDGKEIKLVQPR